MQRKRWLLCRELCIALLPLSFQNIQSDKLILHELDKIVQVLNDLRSQGPDVKTKMEVIWTAWQKYAAAPHRRRGRLNFPH